jgi:hypothetical protein
MKIESRNSNNGPDHRRQADKTPGLECRFWVGGLCIVACWLFCSYALAATTPKPADPNALSQPSLPAPSKNVNTPDIHTGPNSKLGRKLWRIWIGAPVAKTDSRSRTELDQIIEQIASVKLEAVEPIGEPALAEPAESTAEPSTIVLAPIVEPNKISSVTEPTEGPQDEGSEPNLPDKPDASQTMLILRKLLQHPDQVRNPFELGEVLFFNGNLKEAAVFYTEALKRNSADPDWLTKNKGWTLFQIGNSLRNSDMPTAKQMYQRLIAECPDSHWTDLAKARIEMIDWYLKDNPSSLIGNME